MAEGWIKKIKRLQQARGGEEDGRGVIISRTTKKKTDISFPLKCLIIPGVKKVKKPLDLIFVSDLSQSVALLCSCCKGLCESRI